MSKATGFSDALLTSSVLSKATGFYDALLTSTVLSKATRFGDALLTSTVLSKATRFYDALRPQRPWGAEDGHLDVYTAPEPFSGRQPQSRVFKTLGCGVSHEKCRFVFGK